MITLWPRIFLLGSVLGVTSCLLMVSWVVWLEGRAPVFPPLRVEYESKLIPIEQKLVSLLDNQLGPEHQSELESLRASLLELIVPAEAKDFHLQLILKLGQLEQALDSSTFKTDISAAKVTADIRKLIAEQKW